MIITIVVVVVVSEKTRRSEKRESIYRTEHKSSIYMDKDLEGKMAEMDCYTLDT